MDAKILAYSFFGEKLHLSFAGVEIVNGSTRPHVLVAELTRNFDVVRVWYPHYALRTETEKNWVFFECQGELFAVYSTMPHHQILRIGEQAKLAYSTPTSATWAGGLVRGGAAPVHHRGQWYHFFHGWKLVEGIYVYSIGVLTFEESAAFSRDTVCRITNSMRRSLHTHTHTAILDNGSHLK